MPGSVCWAAARAVLATEPVLLFGGPYSNLEATKAVLAEARQRDIPFENIICTGDVVAYCAEPQETVDLLRDNNIAVVMGNCEEQLGEGAEDCGCGFEEGTACDLLSDQWFRFASAHLDEAALSWMRNLPRKIEMEIAGFKFAVIHGSVSKIAQFIFASTDDAVLGAEINLSGCDGIIGGHCGLPFTRQVGAKLWHNPGVIGMPANDGTPRGWYSVLTPGDNMLEIHHVALSYDHQSAAQKMQGKALPPGYADCLESGLWPSLDVLPDIERSATGHALELSQPVIFPR